MASRLGQKETMRKCESLSEIAEFQRTLKGYLTEIREDFQYMASLRENRFFSFERTYVHTLITNIDTEIFFE